MRPRNDHSNQVTKMSQAPVMERFLFQPGQLGSVDLRGSPQDIPLNRERLLYPDQRFRQYEMRPGRDWREQLVGFASHVHRNRSIRFGEGTVVEQKGAIYEMDCLLKVVERPGRSSSGMNPRRGE